MAATAASWNGDAGSDGGRRWSKYHRWSASVDDGTRAKKEEGGSIGDDGAKKSAMSNQRGRRQWVEEVNGAVGRDVSEEQSAEMSAIKSWWRKRGDEIRVVGRGVEMARSVVL